MTIYLTTILLFTMNSVTMCGRDTDRDARILSGANSHNRRIERVRAGLGSGKVCDKSISNVCNALAGSTMGGFRGSTNLGTSNVTNPGALSTLKVNSTSSKRCDSDSVCLLTGIVTTRTENRPCVNRITINTIILGHIRRTSFPSSVTKMICRPKTFSYMGSDG